MNGNIELLTGNAKEIADNATTSYGAYVTNYDIDNSTGVKWKIFNSDGVNIYLIADDYVDYDKIPATVKTSSKPNHSTMYSNAVYFTDILKDYNGSNDISNHNLSNKWLSKYSEKNFTSEYENMKAIAYMLDTNLWREFKEDTAIYAIGGPTLEILFESYNAKKRN